MRTKARLTAIRPLWLMALLMAAGCTSATAPPVVPAPELKDPEKKEDAKQITKAVENVAPKANADAAASKSEPTTIANTAAAKESKTEVAPVVSTEQANSAANKPADATVVSETATKTDVEPAKVDTKDSKTQASSRADTIRLLAFAPSGPLVIDLRVFLDDEPLGKKRTAAIDRIFASLDEDADGRISWEQLIKHPRVMSGLYGNAPVAEGAAIKDLLEKYDIVKNGRVDKDELPRFFSDDRGATKAFSLLAPGRGAGSPGEDSVILAWLDADGDGQLSAEERSQAKSQLRIRDSDDDRVLSSSELTPQMDARMAGMMPMKRPSSGPPSGILLGPSPRWETLSYYLDELYAGAGRKLRTSHFPGTPELAKSIDGNKDGKISQIELQNFSTVPANVTLTLKFVSHKSKEDSAPKLEASTLGGDWSKWQPEVKLAANRMQFTADEYSISMAMTDLVGVSSEMEVAMALFTQSDADKNGYLEEKEFNMPQNVAGLTFAQVDENKDGKVYPEEVEKLAAERQVVAGTQAVIKVEVTGDPFLGVLDRDGDGRLSDREIREAEKNLTALDKDQDGLVGIGELPQSMKISIIRGIVADGTIVPDSPGVAINTSPGDSPLWFTKMDTNGDGELNEIEFIGTTEQFSSLDKDHDGVIAASEVATPKTEKAADKPTETPAAVAP